MTVLMQWLLDDNPLIAATLPVWTQCLPPVDVLPQYLACTTKCNNRL